MGLYSFNTVSIMAENPCDMYASTSQLTLYSALCCIALTIKIDALHTTVTSIRGLNNR